MIVDRVTVGPFEENCYLLIDAASGAAVLVDPGDEGERIVDMVNRHGVAPSAVWLTHAHLDHIGAVSAVRRAWPGIPVSLHRADQAVYARGAQSAAKYGIPWEQPAAPELEFNEGDVLSLGTARFEVWHVPGHAPGHVAFIGHGMAVSGDCIFAGSVGRTDLPLSDPAEFSHSLARLLTLPGDVAIHPGHGPLSTMAREAESNPFLNGIARVPRAR